MTELLFPTLSREDTKAEGVVATWFVADGAAVAEGDLVAEVAMDKVDAEIVANATGTLRHAVPEGSVVVQGDCIARIE